MKKLLLISVAVFMALALCGCSVINSVLHSGSAAPATEPPAGNEPLGTKKPVTLEPGATGEPVATVGPDAVWNGPQFNILNAAGEEVNIASLAEGRPMLINIWATWCPPCVGELPHFQAQYLAHGDEIAFVMVSLDDSLATATDFAAANGYTFPLYYDVYTSCAEYYNVSYIPCTVYIDADGNMIDSVVGGLDEDSLQTIIDGLLG